MKNPIDRFLPKIKIINSGCWKWTANITKNGYSLFRLGLTQVYGHRFIYEYFYDLKIPKELVIDHLCKNTKCVNPLHLELVTQKTNCQRVKPHTPRRYCLRGHEITLENTFMDSGRRRCKICYKKYNFEYYNQVRKLGYKSLKDAGIQSLTLNTYS